MRFIIYSLFVIFSIATSEAAGAGAFESAFGRVPTVSQKESSAISAAAEAATADESIKILKDASENKWAGAGIFFNLANLYAVSKNNDAAIENYKKALEKLPSFFMAQKNLGLLCAEKSDDAVAFEELKKALALSGGSDAEILMWLASYYVARNDFSAAIAACNQALIYLPDSPRAQLAKARILLQTSAFAECESLCLRLLAGDTKNFDAAKTLILSRARRGDFTGSIAACELMQALDSAQTPPLNLGDLYYNAGLYPQSAVAYEKSGAHSNVARAALAMIQSGELESALEISKKVEGAGASKIRALAFLKLGKSDDAIREFALYFKSGAIDSQLEIAYAQLAFSKNNYPLAAEFFTRALADSSTQTSALYGIMRVCVAQNDVAGALKTARKIFAKTKNPELEPYIKYLDELEKSAQ